MDRDHILLTPGPLTTSLRTKLAMLRDWGSWDADFNAITARIRGRLLDIVHGAESHVVVPFKVAVRFQLRRQSRHWCHGTGMYLYWITVPIANASANSRP